MNVRELIDVDAPCHRQLLQRAALLADHLPAPSADGPDRIALAFGRDRDAFAAALLACWLRGFGAAICENSRRERVQPVSEDPRTAMLLHDTDSGRTLQVPRLFASATLPPPPTDWPELPDEPIAVHTQDDAGDRTWCAWSGDRLQESLAALPAEPTGDERRYTPGFLPALFWNVLRPLRTGIALPATTPTGVRAAIRFAPPVAAEAIDGSGSGDVPRDPNGQVLFAEYHLARGRSRRGGPVQRRLTFATEVRDDGGATVRTTLPEDYLFFEGHFEGYAVLAGGVQLHELLLPGLRALCGELPPCTKLDGLKFASRIAPGDPVEIVLQPNDDRTRVTFTFQDGERRYTAGRVTFASALPTFATGTDAS